MNRLIINGDFSVTIPWGLTSTSSTKAKFKAV